MSSKIFNALKISALAVVLSVGIGYVYAQYVGPCGSPQTCNAAAPLNISGASQEKKLTDASGTTLISARLIDNNGNAIAGIVSASSLKAGVLGNGGAFGVVGVSTQTGGTGVSGNGDYGVVGIGTVADFFAKSTGVRFSDGSQQKTAVTWKVCEGSNATYFNESFMVPPSWGQYDCMNELAKHISPLSWWRVGCFDTSSPNGSSWGAMGGGLPANNSCGWGAIPPPDTTKSGSFFCWKFPDQPC